jgi:drug/metabolite transporter (DMT)-like permease
MAYGAVVLTAIGLATESPIAIEWSAVSIGALLYLALFGSVVAFVLYYRLLKVVPVSLLALVSYAFPIVAVALGWLVLDEALSGSTLAGAGMVLVGIALATWRRRATAPAGPEGRRGRPGGAATAASPTRRGTPT